MNLTTHFFLFYKRVCKVCLINNKFISYCLLIPIATLLHTLRSFCFPCLKYAWPEYFMDRKEKATVTEDDIIKGKSHPHCPDNYWSTNCGYKRVCWSDWIFWQLKRKTTLLLSTHYILAYHYWFHRLWQYLVGPKMSSISEKNECKLSVTFFKSYE